MVRATLIILSLATAATSWGQIATAAQRGTFPLDKKYGTLHFNANIGSYKVINGEGRIEMALTGTIVIINYKGNTIQVSGNMQKQYDKDGRVGYIGTGRVVLNGTWRGVQVFGRGLQAVWYGLGSVRLRGEFDKNLNTGQYWYDDSTEKEYWYAQGVLEARLPKPKPFEGPTPQGRTKPRPPSVPK